MSHALVISSLRKSFPLAGGVRHVLNGITLHVAAGEVVAVLGENGCGKSTLLRCIMGVERPDGGSVTHGPHSIPSSAVRVACVTQNPLDSVFPSLTVSENIYLARQHAPGFALGFPCLKMRAQSRHQVCEWALDSSLHTLASDLSGGQQQRLALLSVLLREPHVLLLDEVTANLDARGSQQVETALFPTIRQLQIPTIIVTHDIEFARRVGDRMVVIENGVLLGDVELATRHTEPPTAQAAPARGSVSA